MKKKPSAANGAQDYRRPLIGLVTRRELKGLLFLLPWLIGFVVFFAVPMVQSFIYALSSVKFTGSEQKIAFVGMENYKYLFNVDVSFVDNLKNFYIDSALRLAVILVFSLIIALMLNQKIRGKGIFRTLFFLPIIVVSGPVLERLVNEGATTISMIESYGINGIISDILPQSVARPISSLFSQLILVLWYSGVPILIYMTGLQKINVSLYEASMIDGANGWISFWKITLPAIRPMILINGIYTLVFLATSGLNEVIESINYRMFNSPANDIGLTGYGLASAMAWFYAVTLAAALLILMLITKERKARQIALTKSREQIRIERLHAESAKKMKGGRRRGKVK